jgi:hypothetical protein
MSNNRKSLPKARQQSGKIHFEHTGKNMTSKAGLIPVVKFLDKLCFNELFRKTIHHDRKDNAVYRLEEGVFLILTGLIGGAFSISKCALLWSGCGVLQRVPDETTFRSLIQGSGSTPDE